MRCGEANCAASGDTGKIAPFPQAEAVRKLPVTALEQILLDYYGARINLIGIKS